MKGGAVIKRVLRKMREPARRPERNPDVRQPLESLDDWILFGPRMR